MVPGSRYIFGKKLQLTATTTGASCEIGEIVETRLCLQAVCDASIARTTGFIGPSHHSFVQEINRASQSVYEEDTINLKMIYLIYLVRSIK